MLTVTRGATKSRPAERCVANHQRQCWTSFRCWRLICRWDCLRECSSSLAGLAPEWRHMVLRPRHKVLHCGRQSQAVLREPAVWFRQRGRVQRLHLVLDLHRWTLPNWRAGVRGFAACRLLSDVGAASLILPQPAAALDCLRPIPLRRPSVAGPRFASLPASTFVLLPHHDARLTTLPHECDRPLRAGIRSSRQAPGTPTTATVCSPASRPSRWTRPSPEVLVHEVLSAFRCDCTRGWPFPPRSTGPSCPGSQGGIQGTRLRPKELAFAQLPLVCRVT